MAQSQQTVAAYFQVSSYYLFIPRSTSWGGGAGVYGGASNVRPVVRRSAFLFRIRGILVPDVCVQYMKEMPP